MESHLVPLASVDLQAFSDRAAAWTEAHQQHRDDTRTRALSLAAQARAADQASADSTAAQVSETAAPPTAAPTTASPSTTAAPATTAPATTVASDGDTGTDTTVDPTSTVAATVPTEEQWEALRQCESSGNYRAISIAPAGRYRGAYQFSRSTWDWVAPQIGADYLVGVDPAEASPEDQDRMAKALWNINGWAPWPACSRMLGYL